MQKPESRVGECLGESLLRSGDVAWRPMPRPDAQEAPRSTSVECARASRGHARVQLRECAHAGTKALSVCVCACVCVCHVVVRYEAAAYIASVRTCGNGGRARRAGLRCATVAAAHHLGESGEAKDQRGGRACAQRS
eukprot:6180572-Pleurochrysis_carterae.AAC.2